MPARKRTVEDSGKQKEWSGEGGGWPSGLVGDGGAGSGQRGKGRIS